MLQEQRKKTSKFIAFAAVACTILAALGDWKVLNNAYGGLPKAIALGTIVCAFLQFLVAADFIKLKKAVGFFPIFPRTLMANSAVLRTWAGTSSAIA